MSMSLGATKLPLRHISIRVPWHDAGWNGTVCHHPIGNASCLILKSIHEKKDEREEDRLAGKQWDELDEQQRPPCVSERAGFMAPFAYTRTATQAYAAMGSASHAHFLPTPYRHAPYSAACIPYNWMLRSNSEQKVEEHGITGFVADRETRADELLGWHTSWVQFKENQLALLDTFFSAIEPEKSLCFFYAKRTPLSESAKRVIVGVGRVLGVEEPVEFRYSEPREMRGMLWDRDVLHSIRPGFVDGFLLPYHALLDAAAKDPTLDLSQFVAFAPDDAFEAFSYVSEHVTHDHAIAALLSCAEALRRAAQVIEGDWDIQLAWIDTQLNRLWQLRGPCPGLGSALSAYGIEQGTSLAYELSRSLGDNEHPWPTVEALFADPSQLGPEWQGRISGTLASGWTKLPEERRALLKLLSRFNITADQAARFYREDKRKDAGIAVTDAELLSNPYRICELDRVSQEAITVQTIDRGVFPDAVVRDAHPLPEPSAITDPADPRRVRALMAHVLEDAAGNGNTLLDRDGVIQGIEKLNLQPPCPVTYDLLLLIDDHLAGEVVRVAMSDGSPAYQLVRLSDMGALIRDFVNRRAVGKRHTITADWASLLLQALRRQAVEGGPSPDSLDEAEQQAHEEKAAALAELAASRISVLIGAAGTGKTTLLSVLADVDEIKRGGLLLLAPTGKARVQLERRMRLPAQTLAQFLVKRGQYRWQTGAYTLATPDHPPEKSWRTVIIDEASMLTEEQLAATLSALSGVERLILVGDPRQLPPIGAGRPFVDIVNRLKPDRVETTFPRVGPGYAELTIRRRTTGDERDDVLLAEWFGGQSPDPGADQVWERVAAAENTETLHFVQWTSDVDLQEKILDTIAAELSLSGRDDSQGFERSLGGIQSDGYVYFNRGQAEFAESWQILSPVNDRAYGITELNRIIQRHFRKSTLAFAERRWSKIPKPFGTEDIVYGDKVINVANKRRDNVWPKEDALGYVANGEVGVVIGRTTFGKKGKRPRDLQVEFSSQPGFSYDFYPWEFKDTEEVLQLAYALTIHKAQGSEFGITFLVLPDPLPMLSRELIYTALTRQRRRVVILHQGDLTALKSFASPVHSETGRRLTNLFAPPEIIEVEGKLLEANLIHRTRRGEAVRSKSEVIIADQLFARGLDYTYEPPFRGLDNTVRYPDFLIEDPASGQTVYWEHLGLLHDPTYRARWERKLAWYRAQGVVPWGEEADDAAVLVTSRDDPAGGIDSGEIARTIEGVFGP